MIFFVGHQRFEVQGLRVKIDSRNQSEFVPMNVEYQHLTDLLSGREIHPNVFQRLPPSSLCGAIPLSISSANPTFSPAFITCGLATKFVPVRHGLWLSNLLA